MRSTARIDSIITALEGAGRETRAEVADFAHRQLLDSVTRTLGRLTVETLERLPPDELQALNSASFRMEPSVILDRCGPEGLLAIAALRGSNHMSYGDSGRHDFADVFTAATGSPFNVYNLCAGNVVFSRLSLGERNAPYSFDSGAVRVVNASKGFAALSGTDLAEIFSDAVTAADASPGVRKQHSIVTTWGSSVGCAHTGRKNLLDDPRGGVTWEYSETEQRRLKIDLDGAMGIVLAVRQCPIAVLGFSFYQERAEVDPTRVGILAAQLQGLNPRDEKGEVLETRHNICREWREILVHSARLIARRLGLDETLIIRSSAAPWASFAEMDCRHLDLGASKAGFKPPAADGLYWREERTS